jgi:Peptidase family S41
MSLAFLAFQPALRAETRGETPDFKEVYQLIKAHVPGISDAELDQAAIKGLLTVLGSKVSLVTNGAVGSGSAETRPVTKTGMFDGNIGYLRVGHVADTLAKEVQNVYQQLNATNKLKGLVLDLRYADGSDYAAVVAAADLFIAKAQPLLNWGSGTTSSHEKSDPIQLPIAILVNSETAGAAEALAAVLRSTGVGLILGSRTAGRATISQDFPLKTGGQLRVATAPVNLGNGTALSADGLKPDIDVSVNLEDERTYFADSFYVDPRTNASASGSSTNPPGASRRLKFNEADLVREHREGMDRDTNDPPKMHEETPRPVVSDPALARAIDLLKGLAVVRQSRS